MQKVSVSVNYHDREELSKCAVFLRLGCSAADLDLALARGLLFKKEKLVRETRYNKQNLYRNNREGENNKKRRERQMRRDM